MGKFGGLSGRSGEPGGGGGAQLPQSGGPDGGRGQDGGAGTVSGGGPVRGPLGVVLAAGRKFSRRSGLRGSGRRHPHRERGADSVRAPLRQLFRILGRGSLHL